MKTVPPALATHLNQSLTTLAYLLKIERTDGVTTGFTTHDRPLTVASQLYQAADSFTLSELAGAQDLAPSNAQVLGALSSAAISEGDIRAGRYDGAALTLYLCNWADPAAGALILRHGRVGTITHDGQNYRFELIGLLDRLEQTLTHSYTRTCRYTLGESACGVDLTAAVYRRTGTLSSVTDAAQFSSSARTEAAGFFSSGSISFTSGANINLSASIKSFASGHFTQWQPLPHTPAVGDAYVVYAGCDKQFSTCRDKFSNALNFGGFPHIPGTDRLLQTPDAKID